MVASPLMAPFYTGLDSDGNPLSGGLVYTYTAGTTTPKNSFTSATGLTPNSNPVVLDSAGRAEIWLSGSYRIDVKTSADVLVRSVDNFTAFSAGGNMGTDTYDPANIAQQIVGTTAVQTLTNKTLTAPVLGGTTIGTASNVLIVGAVATPSASVAGTQLSNCEAISPNLSSSGATTSSTPQWQFINGNGVVGNITTDASATAFNTSSDEKLKDNVEPISNSGAIIDALEPVKFTWKTKAASIGYGVLAQQAYKVFPDAVTKGNDKEPHEEGFVGWSVDYSKFIPHMLAELKALRAREAVYISRIEALEAKCQ